MSDSLAFRGALLLVSLLLFSVPVGGQTITGTLVDDDTQEGIDAATITLLGSTRNRIRSTLTDSLGNFVLPVPNLGAYYLEAERIGYGTTVSQSFNVAATDTTTVTFFLAVAAVRLEPIVVGIPTVIGSEVFAQRMATGQGVFFTPTMIDSLRPTQYVGEIFRHADDDIFLTWQWGLSENGRYGPIPKIRSFRGKEGCLNYIVDRTPVPAPLFEGVRSVWGVVPLADLEPEDLVAIEIYRSWSEVPEDYEQQILANTLSTRQALRDMRRAECGVVVIWTERGWTGGR